MYAQAIEVEVLFPEVTYAWRPSDVAKDTEMEAALRILFDENFRFPLGEYVSVDGHGDITSHDPGYGYGINASSETFGPDVSRLPLGYGIYCLTVHRE